VDGVLQDFTRTANLLLSISGKSGIVIVRRKDVEVTKEEAARKIEEHLMILADYDVIDVGVVETLTEYVWKILTEEENPDVGIHNVSELKAYWEKLGGEDEIN